jgi:hypothetical protein
MTAQPELLNWPNIDQVAAATGLSRRTLERQLAAGEWNTRKRPRSGMKPETVFDPDQVAARAPAPLSSVVRANPATDPAKLAESKEDWGMIAEIAAMVCQQVLSAIAPPPEPEAKPLFVDLREASEITGLSTTCLRGLIKDGNLPHVLDRDPKRHQKTPRVRRADLNGL